MTTAAAQAACERYEGLLDRVNLRWAMPHIQPAPGAVLVSRSMVPPWGRAWRSPRVTPGEAGPVAGCGMGEANNDRSTGSGRQG